MVEWKLKHREEVINIEGKIERERRGRRDIRGKKWQ